MDIDKQKVIVVKRLEKSSDNRNILVAFPVNKIESIETVNGSHAIYTLINGVSTSADFNAVIAAIGERIDIS